MTSGFTTPVDESSAVAVTQHPEIKVEEQQLQPSHLPSLPLAPGPSSKADGQQFSFQAADGRLSVVSGHQRYNTSHMRDGFYGNDLRHGFKAPALPTLTYNLSALPMQGQPRLPMRGTRTNRGLSSQPRALAIQEEGFQDDLVQVDDGKWGNQIMTRNGESGPAHDSDDEVDNLGGFAERIAASGVRRPSGLGTRPARDDAKSNKVAQGFSSRDRKHSRPSVDYDDDVLSTMTFQNLMDEPFDLVPRIRGASNEETSATNLATRLELIQSQGDHEQRQLFKNMTIDEWEDAGQWFVDQFASIMTRLREARRGKRRTVEAFEAEASQREEAIRLRTNVIDKKLNKMKRDGQRVVRYKEL